MLTDAHFHALDLAEIVPDWEAAYRSLGVLGMASCHSLREIEHTESLRAAGLPLLTSFGVHPQDPDASGLQVLEDLATRGRLDALGECGYDLFTPEYAAHAAEQEKVLDFQLGLAERRGLPLVFHSRKAMDRVFALFTRLKRLKAVIFHAWPGSAEEGLAILKRGVDAYFSLGADIMRGRRRSLDSCARLPLERLLSETDAPYQAPPPSRRAAGPHGPCLPADLPLIVETMAGLRGMEAAAMEEALEANFRRAYGRPA